MGRLKTTVKVEPVQKRWLNHQEAMNYLGCSNKFLRTLRDKALVSFSQYGSKMIWYDLNSLDRFLQKNRVV